MPPVRHEIFCGLTFEKSNAGEMKFATMLMPTVAVTNVRPPSRIANGVSMSCTVLIGSVTSWPNTGTVAAAVMTVRIEKNRKLIGRPEQVALLDRLEAPAVPGEVAEVQHRAGEVRHHDGDRGDHDRDRRGEAQVLARVQVEVDARPAGLGDQVDGQDDHDDVDRGT